MMKLGERISNGIKNQLQYSIEKGKKMDNYIVINGKKAELTQEQLEKLGIVVERDPFARVGQYEKYFLIDYNDDVLENCDHKSHYDDKRFDIANYCTDKELMEQRALHETLNRLLWRYSMQNGGREIKYGKNTPKFFIYWNESIERLRVERWFTSCAFGVVYFDTKDTAEAAIKEIVKPFMEQHPEFRW